MKTYTVTISVKDNETGEVLMDAEIPNAKREDMFEPGAATPSLSPVAQFILKASAS
jgi:hypothetical protein